MVQLADVLNAQPGDIVDVLCVPLGVEGPLPYETNEGASSFYARVQLADESLPTGLPLLIFGPASYRVLSIRLLLPILFTQVIVKKRNRHGLSSLVWHSARSGMTRNPATTEERRRLETWSHEHLGPLVEAAQCGFVKSVSDRKGRRHIGTSSTIINSKTELHPVSTAQTHRNVKNPMPTLGRLEKEDITSASITAAAQSHLNIVPSLNTVLEQSAPCMVQVRVVGAKLPSQTRKRSRTPETLNGTFIQSLVHGGCQRGCTAGSKAEFPDPSHFVGCMPYKFATFWLDMRDGGNGRAMVLVKDAAAERVFLGARARDVRDDAGMASRAAYALSCLVHEQGLFTVVLTVAERTEQSASSGRVESAGAGACLELVQLLV